MFSSIADFKHLCKKLAVQNYISTTLIRQQWNELAAPPGSLAFLEDLVCWLGASQKRDEPRLYEVKAQIYVGRHGHVNRSVTPWSISIDEEIVRNLQAGTSAVNCLAKTASVRVQPYVLNNLQPTHDFTQQAAMDELGFLTALQEGYASVEVGTDLLCLGEVGLGNTTAAAAQCCALTGEEPGKWCGMGTGDERHRLGKLKIVEKGLQRHAHYLRDPLSVAQYLGGYEMPALMGAVVAGCQKNIPMIVDGFVTLASVAPLLVAYPNLAKNLLLSHTPSLSGHTACLAQFLGVKPVLKECLLRLGEGSGAVLVVPFFRAALSCYTSMAHLPATQRIMT